MSRMSFDEAARKAVEALDVAESGRLRPMALRQEGPRAYPASRVPPAPITGGTPASSDRGPSDATGQSSE